MNIYDILFLNEDGEQQASNPPDKQDKNNNDADDDFSIDTSLDDGNNDEEPEEINPNSPPEDNSDNGEDDGSSEGEDNMGAPVDDDESADQEVEANTDIFASLSAEEQQVKIKELKKQYSSLYSSCDDILERINNLEVDENNLDAISRISSSLCDMKIYISDYLNKIYPSKSYIENDIVFSRFLSIINSITNVLDDVAKKKEKEEKDEKKNAEKE